MAFSDRRIDRYFARARTFLVRTDTEEWRHQYSISNARHSVTRLRVVQSAVRQEVLTVYTLVATNAAFRVAVVVQEMQLELLRRLVVLILLLHRRLSDFSDQPTKLVRVVLHLVLEKNINYSKCSLERQLSDQ